MHTAFLWLSLAVGLRGAPRPAEAGRTALAVVDRLRAVLTPSPAQHIARRSGWTRAMGEVALIPVRGRASPVARDPSWVRRNNR